MDLSAPQVSESTKLEDPSTSYDNTILLRSFQAINKRYFKNKVKATILWEVPRGFVNIRENPNDYVLDQEETLIYKKALELIGKDKIKEAAGLLKPLAHAGHKESQLAMCHILKRTHGNWKQYAEMHNASVRTIKAVPAACYYPESRTIAIHPHLHQRNVPQFVLRYLIYHECCHQIVPSSQDEQHPEEFMRLELQAPRRARALQWLEKEGFPTLRDCTP